MATQRYVKGNLVNLFIYDVSAWRTLSYSQNNSLTASSETTQISSKDHGIWGDTETTGLSWSMAGEYIMTPTDADVVMNMQASGKNYTFCFCQVNESQWAPGIQPVTDISTNAKWTPGAVFARYGNGQVTNCELLAQNGEQCTLSLEITGSGSLSSTAPVNASILKYGV